MKFKLNAVPFSSIFITRSEKYFHEKTRYVSLFSIYSSDIMMCKQLNLPVKVC